MHETREGQKKVVEGAKERKGMGGGGGVVVVRWKMSDG